jgi:hypothetical protein
MCSHPLGTLTISSARVYITSSNSHSTSAFAFVELKPEHELQGAIRLHFFRTAYRMRTLDAHPLFYPKV